MADPGLMLAIEFQDIYRSPNFGVSWSLIRQDYRIHDIMYMGSGVVIAALRIGPYDIGGRPTGDSKYLRSTDYGQTFSVIDYNNPLYMGTTACVSLGGGVGLMSVYPHDKKMGKVELPHPRIIRTTNYGLTWVDNGYLDAWRASIKFTRDICALTSQIILCGGNTPGSWGGGAGTRGLIFRSTDGGVTFDMIFATGGTPITHFLHLGGGTVLVTESDKIFKSTDWGVTWAEFSNIELLVYDDRWNPRINRPAGFTSLVYLGSGVILATAYSQWLQFKRPPRETWGQKPCRAAAIIRSTDSGATWTTIHFNESWINDTTTGPFTTYSLDEDGEQINGTILCHTNFGILRSPNKGLTWSNIGGPIGSGVPGTEEQGRYFTHLPPIGPTTSTSTTSTSTSTSTTTTLTSTTTSTTTYTTSTSTTLADYYITTDDPNELITIMSECDSGTIIDLNGDSTYTLTEVNNVLEGPNGLPVVSKTLIIRGNGATIERSSADGTPLLRFFYVASAGDLTLYDMTLKNGDVG